MKLIVIPSFHNPVNHVDFVKLLGFVLKVSYSDWKFCIDEMLIELD